MSEANENPKACYTTATGTLAVPKSQHIPIDDLRARLDLLRRAGAREYRDGDLTIILAAERPPQIIKGIAAQGVLCDPVNQE